MFVQFPLACLLPHHPSLMMFINFPLYLQFHLSVSSVASLRVNCLVSLVFLVIGFVLKRPHLCFLRLFPKSTRFCPYAPLSVPSGP